MAGFDDSFALDGVNMPIKYYSGMVELSFPIPVLNEQFLAIGGIKSKHNYFDSFKRLAGKDTDGQLLPVTRSIQYSEKPSLHSCGSKCRNAKGHDCECECGGKNHGAG